MEQSDTKSGAQASSLSGWSVGSLSVDKRPLPDVTGHED